MITIDEFYVAARDAHNQWLSDLMIFRGLSAEEAKQALERRLNKRDGLPSYLAWSDRTGRYQVRKARDE